MIQCHSVVRATDGGKEQQMIVLTRLTGEQFVLNADLIRYCINHHLTRDAS